MAAYELQLSQELILWFEQNLPNPPTYNCEWGKAGTSWFKMPVPKEMLEKMQQMERLMEKYGEPVDRLEISAPEGTVIFEDDYQIVVMDPAPVSEIFLSSDY